MSNLVIWQKHDTENALFHISNLLGPGTCSLEEPCDQLDIRETDKGYSYTMDVPSAFFGLIIGKKAETKKKIERETQTQIIIPRSGTDEDTLGE